MDDDEEETQRHRNWDVINRLDDQWPGPMQQAHRHSWSQGFCAGMLFSMILFFLTFLMVILTIV
jgi:hypothetical protein